jgi:hypothetical protein
MSSIRADECLGLRNVAGQRRPDHHVRAGFQGSIEDPVKTEATPFRRGRSEAESLDGNESEPIIDDVMVRSSLHLVSRHWSAKVRSTLG